MNDIEVAIIGGGLSGLTTASLLRAAGVEAVVLEGGPVPGGRIQSIRDPETKAVLADIGPTWIWPAYQESASRWVNKLGLAVHEQFDQGLGIYETSADQPPQQMMFPVQQAIARIKGGPQAIVDALCMETGPNAIHVNSPVLALEKQETGYLLQLGNNGRTVKAEKLVIACPLRLALAIDGLPDLLSKSVCDIAASAPTWMASQCKVSAVYNTPFWREAGLSGRVISRVGPLVEVHDISGPDGSPAALFGFCGIPHQIRRKTDLRTEVLRQLTRCFGEKASKPETIEVKDWARESYICSELDRMELPQHPNPLPEIIRQPHDDGGIFFGVSETAKADPGLISGALEAGERVASQILDSRS